MSTRIRGGSGERGSGTVLVAGVVVVMMVVTGSLLVISAYVAAMHHARGAADLVALSGAHAFLRNGDACRVAATAARENQVVVKSCRVVGDDLDFAVEVTVAGRVSAPSSQLPGEVAASATAGRLGLLAQRP